MAQLKDLLVTGDERIVGNSYNNTPKVAFGTCATAAATAEKVVEVADPAWNLQVGDIIGIKFTYQNTASSMTINVNGSGAKQISYANTRPYTGTSGKYCGYAGYTTFYQYDGTYWHWLAFGADDNSDTYTSAYCGTAAGTQAKTASCTYYTATNNSYLHINFRYANSYAGAITLNVDGKGAKPIYINGTTSGSSNYTLPAGPYICYYDGNNYYFRTDGKLTASITGDAATVSGGYTVAKNVPSDAKFTDTTYESKAAASGGTAVSLVTTGEKYTWNNKTSNTGTVTSIATGAGLVGGTITGSGTIKADLKDETKSTLEATSMGSTANKQYAVGLDKNGDLSVNIPWTDNNTTYTFANGTNGFTVTPSGGSAQTVTVTPSISNNVTGSGTSGYLAKFNGANTITSGPQLGSGTTKFLREDGTWQTVSSGTTYTFAGGTNGFTVTPSGGSAQTVSVTPSISNNVTGSGTSGYIAKFNGANTITSGPQLGSGTTTYLRNDATWVNPQNVYVGSSAPADSNYEVWIDTTGVANNTALLNIFYPVGVVYFSTSSTSPGALFGIGTWEAYTPDPFEGIHAWKRTA